MMFVHFSSSPLYPECNTECNQGQEAKVKETLIICDFFPGVAGGLHTRGLESAFAAVIISDPDRFRDVKDEHLPIADLSSARAGNDSADDLVCAGIRHHHFQFNLGKQV